MGIREQKFIRIIEHVRSTCSFTIFMASFVLLGIQVAEAHPQTARDSHSMHYSRNKRPDAVCGSWTPTPAEVTFNIRAVKSVTGAIPEDVVFSMRNRSGCRVVVRATGKVIGTKGDVYTTAGDGQPDSLWSSTNGFADDDTHTPFQSVVAPDTQEYPKTGEILDIEVCSATPPSSYPKGSYFDPFRAGRCARFSNFGPVTFKLPSNSPCSLVNSTDWMNVNATRGDGRHQIVVGTGSGAVKTDRFPPDPSQSVSEKKYTIPFGKIEGVMITPPDGAGDWEVTVCSSSACGLGGTNVFTEVDTTPDGHLWSSGADATVDMYFHSEGEARQAYNYFLCHAPNAKH